MISVTEIAEKLKVSKMMVYRFINTNEIKHSAKDGRTFLYDMNTFQTIKEGLKDKLIISSDNNDEIIENKNEDKSNHIKDNNVIIEIMKSEIEIKNKQIDELTEMNKSLNVTLQQQQQLLLYEQQKNTKLLEENVNSKKWWQWWK
ncbi:helix-turn-helix domain-containing protein [Vagococcus teuberi]